ncbi:MAG TPA: HAMP domain-containing sensor histidine kinase, partial [Anaeromyxobacteraceae bacterium]|nr:HAMP domain-containing sensor histidine kinase [Anaeromyxobacteraceae bacterium]
RIVKDLALLARTGTKRQTLALADVVRNGLTMLPLAVAARATIRVEISETAPVRASEGQLEQMIVNLVTNAALAIPDERVGEIRIRVQPGPEGTVRMEVSDDGEGIDAGIRERIFEPFFTTRALGKGTGLGLSICHAIVTDHGGTISVASEVGKGSTFTVELPTASAPA